MRQIIGHSDSTKIGKYKVIIEKATTDAMQSNMQPRRIVIKPKRFRSAFTTEQIKYLEKRYKIFPYINREQRKEVAAFLKISERSVKIWFQNRRMREKKESHKEFDDETRNNGEFCNDQLYNVPAPPTTNDQCSYSLPLLSSTADTTVKVNTDCTKTNKVDWKENSNVKPENNTKLNLEPPVFKSKLNYYKEAHSQEHLSPYFQHVPNYNTSLPFTIDMKNKRSPSQKYKTDSSAEFSIDLCKKYKEHTTNNTAVHGNIRMKKKMMPRQPSNKTNYHNPKKNPEIQKPTLCPPPKQSSQVDFSHQYCPVMPSVYAPPLMSSGGLLWKPVNFMPVMTTNAAPITIPNHHGSPAHEQSNNCKCNCHGSTQHIPMTLPPSSQNPYAQYVITVPYAHTSPKF